MRGKRRAICLVALTLAATILGLGQDAQLAAQEPSVQLELVTGDGFRVDGQQKWIRFLGQLELNNPRIRSARPGDTVEITTRGSERRPVYFVTGFLSAKNQLVLPGGTFRYGDRAGLSKWIKKLKEGGPEGLFAREVAFGLNEKQLVQLNQSLAVRVTFTTKGERPYDAVRKMAGLLDIDLAVDSSASTALRSEKGVRDELQGVAAGTAITAAVRPLGLILLPEKVAGGKVRLRIADVRQAEQSWPVGWPSKKSPGQTLPKYFRSLNVEIEDIPLTQALEAIQKRLEVPFLLDHNSLARHEIDPTQVQVSRPAGKTYYKDIVDALLKQARLKAELRVDESEQPFLWITTRRP